MYTYLYTCYGIILLLYNHTCLGWKLSNGSNGQGHQQAILRSGRVLQVYESLPLESGRFAQPRKGDYVHYRKLHARMCIL